MEKNPQLPTLKLADNIPVMVQFDGVNGKEIINEQFGTTSYMYIVYDIEDEEKKKVWFATAKQQEMLLQAKVQPGKTYRLLKEKLAGEKYTSFRVEEAEKTSAQTNIQDEKPVATPSTDSIPASPALENIAPEAAAWAIKMAVLSYDYYARGHLLPPGGDLEKEITYIAKKFLIMQHELTKNS